MSLTAIVLLLTVALLIGFETWTVLNCKPGDTESESVRWGMIAFPVMSLFAGVLCGHWFIPRCGDVDMTILAALVAAAVLLVVGQLTAPRARALARRLAAGFFVGLLAGYLFWPLCVDAERGAGVLCFGVCLS